MKFMKRPLSILLSLLLILSVFTIIPATTASAETVQVFARKWVAADNVTGDYFSFTDLYQNFIICRGQPTFDETNFNIDDTSNVYNRTGDISLGNYNEIRLNSWNDGSGHLNYYTRNNASASGDGKIYLSTNGDNINFNTDYVTWYAYTWEIFSADHVAEAAADCTTAGNIEYYTVDGRYFKPIEGTTDGNQNVEQITQAQTVIPATGLAQVGETKYYTLNDAVEAALNTGDDIYLLTTCNKSSGYTINQLDVSARFADPAVERISFVVHGNGFYGAGFAQRTDLATGPYVTSWTPRSGTSGKNLIQTYYIARATVSLESNGVTTYPTSLYQALTGAKEGDTVHILTDIVWDSAKSNIAVKNTNVTLDLGDHTITGAKADFLQVKDGNTLLIENGTIAGDGSVKVGAGSTLALDDTTVSAPIYAGAGATITFANGAGITGDITVPEDYKVVTDPTTGTKTVVPMAYVAQVGETKYEDLQTALDAADGETVVLLTDIDLTAAVYARYTTTLDLAGYTITRDAGIAITVNSTGKLTITDSSDPSTGKITSGTRMRTVNVLGELTLDSGTIEHTGTGLGNCAVLLSNNASFTMNGGTVTGNKYGIYTQNTNATVTITDGTVSGTAASIDSAQNSNAFTISGGTFTCGENGTCFAGTFGDAKVSVSGGTFDTTVLPKYCASGFVPKDNGDGTYTVEVGARVIAYSLLLKDEIGLRFYLNVPEEFDTANAEVSFSWGTGSYQKSAAATLQTTAKTIGGYAVNYYADCFVAARCMTDTIHMEITIGEDTIVVDDYSISQYCDEVVDLYKDNDKLRKCLCDMLDYGDAAQRHFSYKTEGEGADLAGDHIADVDPAWSRSAAPESLTDTTTLKTADLIAYGLEYYASSLVLTSKTKIRLYFKKEYGVDLPAVKVNGESVEWYYNRTYSKYYFEISGIAAKAIFDDFNISFNESDPLVYNVAEYYNSASSETMGATVHTILQRIYSYSMSAKALFTN